MEIKAHKMKSIAHTVARSALILAVLLHVLFSNTTQAQEPAGRPAKPNPKAWQKEVDAAQKALDANSAEQAEALLQAALIEAQAFGKKDYRLAETLSALGRVRLLERDPAGAETFFERALEIRRGDPNREEEAICLEDLAWACQALKKYDEAIRHLLDAQDILDRKFGPDHAADAYCRLRLAQVYELQGEIGKAQPLFEQAASLFLHPPSKVKVERTEPAFYGVRIMRISYRPDYNLGKEAIEGLTRIYMRQGLPDKAENCLKEAVDVGEQRPGPANSDLFSALATLANFYIARTNYSRADPVLYRLEKMEEKQLGLKDANTLNALSQLADAYEHEGKFKDAEAGFQKLVSTTERFESPDSERVLASYGLLADFDVRRGNYEAAAAVYEKYWKRAEKSRSADLRDLPMLEQLTVIYGKLGRDADLEKVYRQEIATYEGIFGSQTPALRKPLQEYAELLHKMKRDAEAKPLEERISSMQTQSVR